MTEEIKPEPCKHDEGWLNTLAGPKCKKCGRIIKDGQDGNGN